MAKRAATLTSIRAADQRHAAVGKVIMHEIPSSPALVALVCWAAPRIFGVVLLAVVSHEQTSPATKTQAAFLVPRRFASEGCLYAQSSPEENQ